MTSNLRGNPSAATDIGKITPDLINPQLLLDIVKVIDPVISQKLPQKRSGFSYTIFVLFACCMQILRLSPRHTSEIFQEKCSRAQISFQSYSVTKFSNGKQRRFFPDQPALSRCLQTLSKLDLVEEFWNSVLLAHLLILKSLKIVGSDLKLIADYIDTPCKKNKDDLYCFGKKEGKTVHRTLSFSVISGDFHQMIANFKIKKRQDKLPLFQKIHQIIVSNGFSVKYAILDRGFYRKRILKFFQQKHVTVIMPGRKCAQTKQKIRNYLNGVGKRYCKGMIKGKYVKKKGFSPIKFDLLLVAKRSFNLKEIIQDLNQKKISEQVASSRIFPLIVMFCSKSGIKTLHGNENYIRDLYRQRWLIEIAFREMNRLGIAQKVQDRNIRLNIMGVRCFLYNIWQTQRFLIKRNDPTAADLELNEFLGMCSNHRYPLYLSSMS
ncbi:MAG: transposase [Candidatus Lokiarchaeota archaeon]|nr:transposase [Candidatus Harpocratesius repetitus]